MSEKISATGICLCGAVTLKVSALSTHIGACHCSMCRTWSGGPLFSANCGKEVTIDGEDSLGVFNSSAWAERGFCKVCGSNLFYRIKASGQYLANPEIFGKQDFQFTHQVFIDEKPTYYEFSNATKNMTGAEVFAIFAPKDK